MNEWITALSGEDDSSHRRGATSRERGTEEIGGTGIADTQASDNKETALPGDLGWRKATKFEAGRTTIATHPNLIDRGAAMADARSNLEMRAAMQRTVVATGDKSVVGKERSAKKSRERGEHEDAEVVRARSHDGGSYRSGWRKRPFQI